MKNERVDFQQAKKRLIELNNQLIDHHFDKDKYDQILKEREVKFNKRFLSEKSSLNTVTIPYLFFHLNDLKYSMKLSHVMEIIKNVNVSRIPGEKSFCSELFNLNNMIHSLLDLKDFLHPNNEDHEEPQNDNYYIIVLKNERIGIKVDYIDKIIHLNEKDILSINEEYINGIYKNEYRNINIQKIIAFIKH